MIWRKHCGRRKVVTCPVYTGLLRMHRRERAVSHCLSWTIWDYLSPLSKFIGGAQIVSFAYAYSAYSNDEPCTNSISICGRIDDTTPAIWDLSKIPAQTFLLVSVIWTHFVLEAFTTLFIDALFNSLLSQSSFIYSDILYFFEQSMTLW